ncbi:hypothetical protein [Actinacidiphila glaucinigra]|uniref:hypothetical protein n=1 Tax=Actinacidiphila glaucinigra TaxID=235986 RepID=UPI003722E110
MGEGVQDRGEFVASGQAGRQGPRAVRGTEQGAGDTGDGRAARRRGGEPQCLADLVPVREGGGAVEGAAQCRERGGVRGERREPSRVGRLVGGLPEGGVQVAGAAAVTEGVQTGAHGDVHLRLLGEQGFLDVHGAGQAVVEQHGRVRPRRVGGDLPCPGGRLCRTVDGSGDGDGEGGGEKRRFSAARFGRYGAPGARGVRIGGLLPP